MHHVQIRNLRLVLLQSSISSKVKSLQPMLSTSTTAASSQAVIELHWFFHFSKYRFSILLCSQKSHRELCRLKWLAERSKLCDSFSSLQTTSLPMIGPSCPYTFDKTLIKWDKSMNIVVVVFYEHLLKQQGCVPQKWISRGLTLVAALSARCARTGARSVGGRGAPLSAQRRRVRTVVPSSVRRSARRTSPTSLDAPCRWPGCSSGPGCTAFLKLKHISCALHAPIVWHTMQS